MLIYFGNHYKFNSGVSLYFGHETYFANCLYGWVLAFTYVLISLLSFLSPRFTSTRNKSVILFYHTTHMCYDTLECTMFLYIYKRKILHVGKVWGKNFNMDCVKLGIWMYHFYFLFIFMISFHHFHGYQMKWFL